MYGSCGLNFIDLMVRQGNIDNPPKTPLVPGFECSGIVEALGDSVKGFEIGDRVMAFVNYNAWAEVVCTPVEFVYKIPDDMSFSEAAAFPMNFVTAYMMLFEVANLREGMSVLVHSAGGGVVTMILLAVNGPLEYSCKSHVGVESNEKHSHANPEENIQLLECESVMAAAGHSLDR
ncbi:hypothetical protein llap_19199 [Limosa lapponica baueri]|uniref:Enoyl reductase (ER) domain-containing protein n=1 Tax=Limosa lapponica baueri TaxID=1758121 RepID=A0A2I0T9L7_LIMLA|nr:hypothetical protein llap_19199 [Limosa lapponica baueri]